jgi:hypothetical protein
VSGLLRRSDQYRRTHRLPGTYDPEELAEPAEDVPVAGEDEILSEIDKIVAENKIPVDDNTFRISAQRRGLLLPFLVNFFGLLIALGGVYGLYLYFQEQERSLVSEPSAFQTAENALIEALRQQSQEELAAKEAEIGDIQLRLSRIEAERESLEANLESEIAAREEALRERLDAELAAERQRLAERGLSEEQLEERTQEFEQSQQAILNEELAALEAEAASERQQLEENLSRLETEFEQQLATLEEERTALQEEVAVREAEIEAEAEAALAAQEAELSEAQRLLSNLAETQERESQVSAQIVGFYNSIREQIREGRYASALETLDTLETYLNDPTLQEIPLIQERQGTERFVINSLRQLVEERQSRSESSGSLLAAARQLQQVSELIARGNQAAAEGDTDVAESLYTEALAVIPAVTEGHDYLVSRREAALEAEAREGDLLEAQGAATALARARQAAEAQRYEEALAEYQNTLSFLPTDEPAVGSMVSEIQRLSLLLDEEITTARQTASSEPLIRDGRSALSDQQNGRAIDSFIRLLEDYPRSAYRRDALAGLEEAIASQRNALRSSEATIAGLGEEIAALEETLSKMEAEVASLQEENQALRVAVTEVEDRRIVADPVPETGEVSPSNVVPEADPPDASPAAEAGPAAERLERLRTAYREYRQREAETLRGNEEAGRIAAKLYLDDFLQEEAVQEVLPGLGDTLRQYDRAFEVSGRRNALLEASDLVFSLSSLTDKEERTRYLTRELNGSSDPRMQEFIRELLSLVEE